MGLLRPCGLSGGQRFSGWQIRIVADLTSTIRPYPFLDLEALYLARSGSRQIFLPDLVAPDALGGSNLWRQALNIEPDHFLRVDDPPLPQRIEVRHNHRMEPVAPFTGPSLKSHHGDFLDVRRFQVMRFNLFGINIFPVAEHDHFFLTPSKHQVAMRVELTPLPAKQPSIP